MAETNRVYESIIDLVASPENPTPMVRISERVNPNGDLKIYLKLERYNPFGSIKDRIALSMLRGIQINEGQCLAEPSSGNTGIALAAIANAKGIPIEIAVPQGIPEEKKTILKLLGVRTLWEADDKLCPLFPNEGARGLVNAMLKSKGGEKYISPNQYENKLNVQAHYETTGPEIWEQTGGQIDYFFAGFGTCGTLTGVGKYLKEKKDSIKIVAVEPAGADHNLPGMKRISDLAEDLVPKILDKSVIDDIVTVADDDAYQTGIRLAREEGILVGPTTGAILYASLQYARTYKGLAVAISPDYAFKYMSFYRPYVENQGKP
ncbi:MAG: cysteine synthase family protein [Planctomycetota bacterium]